MDEHLAKLRWQLRRGFFAEVNWYEDGIDAVFSAMRKVDRCIYVPAGASPYASCCHRLGFNGEEVVTMSKPAVHAFFLHELWKWIHDARAVGKHVADVLDVGSGSGFLSVSMARLMADEDVLGSVVGIDVTQDLALLGSKNFLNDAKSQDLADFLHFRSEDVCTPPLQLDMERFGFIAVSAAARTRLPDHLLQRLCPGGRVIAPVINHSGDQFFYRVDRSMSGSIDVPTRLCPARFVSLLGS
eukprot:TRINITY_DN38492_c0_g1_i1.p1 TRINITY_DN38492_c0_g1~~TRINITY_DN38492_c0_g1_i1.p1  ORF type:complete len:256 (+),score=30.11 TRINITY_DN38492_c0_g1_i1:45-770(+)